MKTSLNGKDSFTTSKNDNQPSIAVEVPVSPTKMSDEDLNIKAKASLKAGDRRKATAYYHELVRRTPNDKEVLLKLASIYLEDNKVGDAFTILKEIKNLLSEEIRNDESFTFKYRFTLAIAHIKNGDTNLGHKYLSKLISQDSTFAPAYAALASNYVIQGKIDTAEFVAKRGIDKAGDDPDLLNIIGVINRNRNELDEAEVWINKALEKNPNHVSSLINRASINILRFEYDTASKDVGMALSINPFSVDALIMASVILHKKDENEAARDILKKVIDIDPVNANARYNLA